MRDYQRKQKQCNEHKHMQHHTRTNKKNESPFKQNGRTIESHTQSHIRTHTNTDESNRLRKRSDVPADKQERTSWKGKRAQQEVWARACKHSPEKENKVR